MQIHIDKNKLPKLMKGKVVQLSIGHLRGEKGQPVDLKLHPQVVKAIMQRKKAGKGYRLALSSEEIAGCGLGDWIKKAKRDVVRVAKTVGSAARKAAPVVVPVLKEIHKQAKPWLKKAAHEALSLAPLPTEFKGVAEKALDKVADETGAYGFSDWLKKGASAAAPALRKLHAAAKPGIRRTLQQALPDQASWVDKIGDSTGAFGMSGTSSRSAGSRRHMVDPTYQYGNSMLPSSSPANHALVYRGFGAPNAYQDPFAGIALTRTKGGSFRALGGSMY